MARYQWVQQQSGEDCAAACLAIVARHHGRDLRMGRIREAVATDAAGTTLAGLEGELPRFRAVLDDGTSEQVSTVVVATGFEPYDPSDLEEYGYRRYANVARGQVLRVEGRVDETLGACTVTADRVIALPVEPLGDETAGPYGGAAPKQG